MLSSTYTLVWRRFFFAHNLTLGDQEADDGVARQLKREAWLMRNVVLS